MGQVTRRIALAAALSALAGGKALAAVAPTAEDMSLGNPKARVQVVEYASLTCPHCAKVHAEVFPAFKTKYVDTGKVRYTLKEFITAPPEVAAAGFLMARCAGPAKYFDVVDAVFRSQPRWNGPIKPIFLEIAQAHGLTEARFNACLTDGGALEALNDRVRRAVEDDKVTSTPSFFVNGKLVKAGEVTLEDLDAAIAAAGR